MWGSVCTTPRYNGFKRVCVCASTRIVGHALPFHKCSPNASTFFHSTFTYLSRACTQYKLQIKKSKKILERN